MSVNAERIQEVAHELKLEYFREWRRNNPEKVKGYAKKRWIEQAKRMLAAQGE